MRCRCLMTMFLAILAAGAAPAGEPVPVEPPEPKWRVEIRRKLEKKVNFEFVQAPLSEAVNFLQQTSDVNMVIDPAVKARGERPITLRMTQASLKQALDWILKLAGLDYELRAGAVFITTPGRLKPDNVMWVHDVSDLLAVVRDCPAPHLGLAGRSREREADVPYRFDAAALVNMITNGVRPASWAPAKGTAIQERRGRLVVQQGREAHREIAALLAGLRAERSGTLEVTARFYAVAPDKLAEAGKAGRLLAEVSASGRSGQRVHAMRGRSWPAPAGKRAAVFTGALLDVRPVVAADGRSVLLHADVSLRLPEGPKGDPAQKVRVYAAPASVRVKLGGTAGFALGGLPAKKGGSELVVAVLGARARPGAALASVKRLAVEAAWKVNIRKALQKKVNLEFTDQPLEECVNYIRGLTDVSVITDTKAFAAGGVDPKMPITLRLTKVELGTALRWVLRMAKLDYRLKKGAVFISRANLPGGDLVLRTYDVQELTTRPDRFTAPKVDAKGSFNSFPAKKKVRTPPPVNLYAISSLQDLVKTVIRPTSWGAGGASVEQRGGRLVVMHSPEVHDEIAALIGRLRASLLREVRVDVALYELPAGAKAGDVAAVKKSGRLLSRLGTVGLNGQALYAAGGAAWPAPKGQPGRFAGGLVEILPTLSPDRRYVALDARLLWVEPDRSSARLEGTLSLELGKPALVRLGTADGRSIVAVVRPSVKAWAAPRTPRLRRPDGDPPLMDPPAARKRPAPRPTRAEFLKRKIRAMLDRAKFDYKRKKYEEADAIVQQVLRLDPKNAAARKLLKAVRAARKRAAPVTKPVVKDRPPDVF